MVNHLVKTFKNSRKGVVVHRRKMNIIESTEVHAEDSEKKAFVFQNDHGNIKTLTYSQLRAKTSEFANLLKKLKLKKQQNNILN